MSDSATQSDVMPGSSPAVDDVNKIPDATDANAEPKTPELEPEKKPSDDDVDESSLPNGVKKRIDKITRQKHEALAESNRLKAEIAELKLQAQQKTAPKAPDVNDFETVEDYVEAMATHKADLKLAESRSQNAQQAQQQKLAAEWNAKADKVRAVAPDFDDAFNQVANISFDQSALESIAEHPKGAEIAYALGKDPSEAYRIAALSPRMQVMAIGELAAKVSLPKPKTVSAAPPPAPSVTGQGKTQKSIADMTDKEYAQWRNSKKLLPVAAANINNVEMT